MLKVIIIPALLYAAGLAIVLYTKAPTIAAFAIGAICGIVQMASEDL